VISLAVEKENLAAASVERVGPEEPVPCLLRLGESLGGVFLCADGVLGIDHLALNPGPEPVGGVVGQEAPPHANRLGERLAAVVAVAQEFLGLGDLFHAGLGERGGQESLQRFSGFVVSFQVHVGRPGLQGRLGGEFVAGETGPEVAEGFDAELQVDGGGRRG
jgi:hypothetical protein